ncbi:MAG: FAD-dependent monooxygenase [Alphaproteobacteria bacterium]
MRIGIVGGGPAGLWLALLIRQSSPGHEVTVWEQNPPGATYGFGVVFSDTALRFVAEAAPAAFAPVAAAMQRWDDLTIVHRDRRVAIDGNGFAAIGRLRLLELLQAQARATGVRLVFDRRIEDVAALDGCDLVVGADGVNSTLRQGLAAAFGTRVEELTNRFVWYGTRQTFPTLSLTFRANADGAFVAHHYRYAGDMSTFIVECDAASFARAGLEAMSDDESRAYCERLFAPDLGGHPLISNRSIWRRFPVLTNERWHAGNVVLIGDALRTVHFSIGSGTRLAMEDAVFLARALAEAGEDVPAALAAFEAARRPVVDKLLAGAAGSYTWYEGFAGRMGLDPYELAYDYMTRSGRMTEERLAAIAPKFVAACRAHRATAGEGAR